MDLHTVYPPAHPATTTATTSKKVLRNASSHHPGHKKWSDRELLIFHASHDRQGDGSISKAEFIDMLISMKLLSPILDEPQKAGSEAEGGEEEGGLENNLESYAKACRVFEDMDVDNSGELSADEFIEAYHRYLRDDPSGFSVDESSGSHVGDVSTSKVTITAVKWWPGAPTRASQFTTVSFFTYGAPPKTTPPELLSLSDFMAAPPSDGAKEGGPATVWLDVVGPHHQATLDWLKHAGLDCATKQAFKEEGVWYKGEIIHPTWGGDGAPKKAAAGAGAGAEAGAASPGGAAAHAHRSWSGVIMPVLWLAHTPFKMGSARALGWCKRRKGGGPSDARGGLHWWLCGSRDGTVVVKPHGLASHSSSHDADSGGAAMATFWAQYVQRFSKGERNEVREAPVEGAAVVGVAGHGSSGSSARQMLMRGLRLRAPSSRRQEEAQELVEAMVRGGEFHVVSKAHLHAKAPHFVRNLVGVFEVKAGGGDAATPTATASAPALLVTIRPYEQCGVVSTVLAGFRARVEGIAGFLEGRAAAGGKTAVGREGREEKFVKSLDAPLLATAIVDSLGVRYNDLSFRILEHWAKVLEACIHEQPSSLHQRHMMKLQDLASRLHGYATKLVESQRKLTGGGGGEVWAAAGGSGGGGKQDFFDVFTRRAEHLHARADRLLGQVSVLQDLYKTKLDEDRNWMVTALTLFTAGTWPLSFLTELPKHVGIGARHCTGPSRLLKCTHPGRPGSANLLALLWAVFYRDDDHLPTQSFFI